MSRPARVSVVSFVTALAATLTIATGPVAADPSAPPTPTDEATTTPDPSPTPTTEQTRTPTPSPSETESDEPTEDASPSQPREDTSSTVPSAPDNRTTRMAATPREDMERHWQQLGGSEGALGDPVGDPRRIGGGHRWDFDGGAIFRQQMSGDTPARVTAVLAPTLKRYDASAGAAGNLGFPLDDPATLDGAATSQRFQHGRIYWSSATGAHAVVGAILSRYLRHGGPAWLGLPTTDERDTNDDTGRVSTFQHGHVYWSSATGAHAVVGAILSRYLRLGGPERVGLPTTEEHDAGRRGSRVSVFERARIYWARGAGAHGVWGAILNRYLRLGGPGGGLGVPTGGERQVAQGARQSFSNRNSLLWDSSRRRTFIRIRYFAHARRITAADVPHTWREGCPVHPRDLRMVRIVHRGWSGDDKVGRMVLHRSAVGEMRDVFRRMHREGFPIRRMTPLDVWRGNDRAAMTADNTSAFNCRNVTGNPYRLSQHSYGNAVDINTIENPYVTARRVYPPQGKPFRDRSNVRKGMIISGDVVTRGMWAHGWQWGARWRYPDYQHFSANGR